jgi:GNAT superfamily N-acetyltransferase
MSSADTAMPPPVVRRLERVTDAEIRGLAELLVDCVDGGASVSFLHPLSPDKARAFWTGVAADVAAGGRALFVVDDENGIVGTVQLVLDLPENQPHRADVSKMLVHRRARRRGLGAALMRAAEGFARESGRSLLVLDTASPEAERLYARLGWQLCGVIPRYALMPTGEPCATSYFYRDMGPA